MYPNPCDFDCLNLNCYQINAIPYIQKPVASIALDRLPRNERPSLGIEQDFQGHRLKLARTRLVNFDITKQSVTASLCQMRSGNTKSNYHCQTEAFHLIKATPKQTGI